MHNGTATKKIIIELGECLLASLNKELDRPYHTSTKLGFTLNGDIHFANYLILLNSTFMNSLVGLKLIIS